MCVLFRAFPNNGEGILQSPTAIVGTLLGKTYVQYFNKQQCHGGP